MPFQRSTTPNGFTMTELMIVVIITLILAAVEIPNLMRARMAANQAAAVANLRTIETAEITYAVTGNRSHTSQKTPPHCHVAGRLREVTNG